MFSALLKCLHWLWFCFSCRETCNIWGGVSDTGQWRFHCSGAEQQNAEHQELLPEKKRDQVSTCFLHAHSHTFIGLIKIWQILMAECVPRSPPRPSPGGLHYSDEDICNNYNGAVLTESTTLTEKPTEVSESEVSLSACSPLTLWFQTKTWPTILSRITNQSPAGL